MEHSMPRLNPRLLILAFGLTSLTGCEPVLNDGGDMPLGVHVDYFFGDLSDDLRCGSFTDAAFLIEEASDVEAALAACESDTTALAEELQEKIESSLTEEEVLVFVTVEYGGCVRGHDLPALIRDGDTLRPWLIKDNSAYGRPGAICPTDLAERLDLLSLDQHAGGDAVELAVGEWNSDLPSSPYEEHGLSPQ